MMAGMSMWGVLMGEDDRAEGLEVAALVASFGSAAFLVAPVMFLPFAFMASLAGAGCGMMAGRRDGATWMAPVGAVAGILLALLFGAVSIDRL